jgi:EAL domain-containing protein (putative c-di-GMP-specific phosphodiesterase class I)/ActR/RegA family two-component response regulator
MNAVDRSRKNHGGRVLLVDDEESVRRALCRALQVDGQEVVTAGNGQEASEWLGEASNLDVVVSDISMPRMNGLELLRAVRKRDPDLPVLLVTANPDLGTALEAIDQGVYKYLPKPVDIGVLRDNVWRAVTLRRLTRLKREALTMLGRDELASEVRSALEASLERALATMWMAYQPIVSVRTGRVYGYEALMRSSEPAMPNPGAILDAAEQLGRLKELGRKVRSLAPRPMTGAGDGRLFVNLHPADLADEALFDGDSPLGRMASRVVLEITERTTLDRLPDIRDRLARLRALGFTLAVDDLGAGYAGLTSFATLEPEIIKLDMTLVRDIDSSAVKRTVVDKMIALAHELKVMVVAEGVETVGERDVLVSSGCDLVQGYLFAKPGRPFPALT